MRSHWTNPTIIRRPTIAALSAAALLVACDQPAGPSRPAGGILADAQAGTVSAHGNGQVAFTQECNISTVVCVGGGQGAQFSFDFSGANTDPLVVTVNGSFSVKFRETGDIVEYQGPALISPPQHQLYINNVTCSITPAGGVTFSVAGCSLVAFDRANSDYFNFNVGPFPVIAEAQSPVVSGGMQID